MSASSPISCRQVLGRRSDLANAGQEREHVAGVWSSTRATALRGRERPAVVLGLRLVARSRPGTIRPSLVTTGQPPRYARHVSGFERRRHDDDLQVRPHVLLHQPDQAEGEVGLQAALVELVEDDDAGRFEERVVQQRPQQDARRDGQDARVATSLAARSGRASRTGRPAGCRARPTCVGPPPGRRCGAARRTRMRRSPARPASSRAGGTRVVLPAPGGACRTTAGDCPQGRDELRQDRVDRERWTCQERSPG